nr:uncharacterized protein LOC109159918 [Ipomoea batatas]
MTGNDIIAVNHASPSNMGGAINATLNDSNADADEGGVVFVDSKRRPIVDLDEAITGPGLDASPSMMEVQSESPSFGVDSWLDLYRNARGESISCGGSDHLPLLLLPACSPQSRLSRCFRFENEWLREGQCRDIVKGVWSGNSDLGILGKLTVCGEPLKLWEYLLATKGETILAAGGGYEYSLFSYLSSPTPAGRETTIHVFADCSFATQVWLAYGMVWGCSSSVDLLAWLKVRFDSLTKSELTHFITICWGIWNARNQKVWNMIDTSPQLVVKKSLAFLKTWKSVRQPPPIPILHASSFNSERKQWLKHVYGIPKLNIDASVHCAADHIGMGWVLRDHDGFFVAAQVITTPGPTLPREAEALAVREALSWLKNNHLDNIIVETDVVVLVRNLHKPSLSPFGLLMDDITVLLPAFQNVKLCHVRRDANVVARNDFSHCTSVTWVDSGPLFISSAVLHDLSIN